MINLLMQIVNQPNSSLTNVTDNPGNYAIEATMNSVITFQEYGKIFLFALITAALISQIIKGG